MATTIEEELRAAHQALKVLPSSLDVFGKLTEARTHVHNALEKLNQGQVTDRARLRRHIDRGDYLGKSSGLW